jgi:hypothetical protein
VPERELDIIDVLLGQHTRIESLFYEIEAAGDRRRRLAFADLVCLLTIHDAVERDSVHQLAGERLLGGDELIRDCLEEEREIRQIARRLVDAGVDSAAFGTALYVLRDAALTHIRHEERFEFPQLRERVPAQRLRELVAVAQAAEEVSPIRRGSAA